MADAYELAGPLLNEARPGCDVYSLDALGGCNPGAQLQQFSGGVMDPSFCEKQMLGNLPLGSHNSYFSPLSMPSANELPAGDGLLRISQVPMPSSLKNVAFPPYGDNINHKYGPTPTLPLFDDLQGSRMEGQDDLFMYGNPQLTLPTNSVPFEQRNCSASMISDPEPILDRDCRIPSSSELLHNHGTAGVLNNQLTKYQPLKPSSKMKRMRKETFQSDKVKQRRKKKGMKGPSCEKMVDYYQYMSDTDVEDTAPHPSQVSFDTVDGWERPPHLKISLEKCSNSSKVNKGEKECLQWVFGAHVPKKWFL